MVPKKTTLLLAAVLMVTGFATANSIEGLEDDVWLNDGADQEIEFEVDFNDECEETGVVYIGEEELEGDSVDDQEGVYNYSFSGFENSGSYEIKASCEENEDGFEDDAIIEAGYLEIGLDEHSDTLYEGDYLEGEFEVELSNDEMNKPGLDYLYYFNDESAEDLDQTDGVFELKASSKDYEELTVKAKADEEFTVEDTQEITVEPIWSVQDVGISADSTITDKTVKYRHLEDLTVDFEITKEGEGESGIAESSFIFEQDDLDTTRWFEKTEDSGGSYTLEMDSTPVLNLDPDESTDATIAVDVGEQEIEIVDELKIERDVEFSGSVLNVRNNNVDAEFEVEDGNRIRRFSTDDGFFEQYIESGEVDSMKIDFPEASLRLANMQVDKDDAGDISYEYYDDVEETSIDLDDEFIDFRPVNLAAFISNYHFEQGRDTWVEMEFDTSDIRPQDIVVYECNEWTFRAEKCSGEWVELDDNDVGLTSGATWTADFPINPLESDRFSHEEGVLSNAYLVGVPEGIDAGLTLEDNLDISSSSFEAGEDLTVSGTVIDDSRGEPINGAETVLELVGEDNEYSFESSTDSEGEFTFDENIDAADNYDVRLTAEREPYESFEEEQDSAIEVFYDVGLSVQSGDDTELTMGEDSVIDYSIENTGQKQIENLEIDVSGLDSDEYSIESEPNSLDSGESADIVLTYSVPDDLESPPSIEVTVTGEADGESVENSATVHTQVDRVVEETDESEEEDSDTETESSSSLNVPDTDELQTATGDFIESQSDMNLALGLMLVFAMILAVAVKQKKNATDLDRTRGRGRIGENSRVQRPSVAPQKVESENIDQDRLDESESKESDEKKVSSAEDKSNGDASDENVCDICGEEFDTDSGLELHKQALHD